MLENMNESSKLQSWCAEIEGLEKRKERGTVVNEKRTGQKEKGKLYYQQKQIVLIKMPLT